ncbi:DNA-binding response regulator (plasmid) [Neobacillus sp. SCS-31]|uniref:DNA-binding response regulator n=1 Tax=Neobacillus oceani TaxID=3115292 RepID=UPI0039065AD0
MPVAEKKINKYQIYNILKNYHWMNKEVKRIEEELYQLNNTNITETAEGKMRIRDTKRTRLLEYLEMINFIDKRAPVIVGIKESAILDCLLDGMSVTAVARHFGMSRAQAHRIRDDIVDKLAEG